MVRAQLRPLRGHPLVASQSAAAGRPAKKPFHAIQFSEQQQFPDNFFPMFAGKTWFSRTVDPKIEMPADAGCLRDAC